MSKQVIRAKMGVQLPATTTETEIAMVNLVGRLLKDQRVRMMGVLGKEDYVFEIRSSPDRSVKPDGYVFYLEDTDCSVDSFVDAIFGSQIDATAVRDAINARLEKEAR